MALLINLLVLLLAVGTSFSFKLTHTTTLPSSSSSSSSKSKRITSCRHFQKRHSQLTMMSKSSTDFFSFFKFPGSSSSPKVSTKEKAITLKNKIKESSKGTKNGITASTEIRNNISEYVKELEKINPTKALTSDSALQGTWRLLYTTNSGSSAGKLGPFIGEVEQEINLPGGIYYNRVTLGPKVFRGTLSATWDVQDTKLWTVKFQDIEFELFGVKLLQKSLGAEGTWRMSYLDEDMRILYAIGGKNTVVENVYI
jgi:hypothetical protein